MNVLFYSIAITSDMTIVLNLAAILGNRSFPNEDVLITIYLYWFYCINWVKMAEYESLIWCSSSECSAVINLVKQSEQHWWLMIFSFKAEISWPAMNRSVGLDYSNYLAAEIALRVFIERLELECSPMIKVENLFFNSLFIIL